MVPLLVKELLPKFDEKKIPFPVPVPVPPPSIRPEFVIEVETSA